MADSRESLPKHHAFSEGVVSGVLARGVNEMTNKRAGIFDVEELQIRKQTRKLS